MPTAISDRFIDRLSQGCYLFDTILGYCKSIVTTGDVIRIEKLIFVSHSPRVGDTMCCWIRLSQPETYVITRGMCYCSPVNEFCSSTDWLIHYLLFFIYLLTNWLNWSISWWMIPSFTNLFLDWLIHSFLPSFLPSFHHPFAFSFKTIHISICS